MVVVVGHAEKHGRTRLLLPSPFTLRMFYPHAKVLIARLSVGCAVCCSRVGISTAVHLVYIHIHIHSFLRLLLSHQEMPSSDSMKLQGNDFKSDQSSIFLSFYLSIDDHTHTNKEEEEILFSLSLEDQSQCLGCSPNLSGYSFPDRIEKKKENGKGEEQRQSIAFLTRILPVHPKKPSFV